MLRFYPPKWFFNHNKEIFYLCIPNYKKSSKVTQDSVEVPNIFDKNESTECII